MEEILGTEINIKYYNTIENLFRIVEAVVATVNQKCQLPYDSCNSTRLISKGFVVSIGS